MSRKKKKRGEIGVHEEEEQEGGVHFAISYSAIGLGIQHRGVGLILCTVAD